MDTARKIAAIAALVLLAAANSAQAETTKLGFRNKKSKMLHLDCSKSVKGPSAYTCFDRDGNETFELIRQEHLEQASQLPPTVQSLKGVLKGSATAITVSDNG